MKKLLILCGALAFVVGCDKDDTASTDSTVYSEPAGARSTSEMSLTNSASTNHAETNAINADSTAPATPAPSAPAENK